MSDRSLYERGRDVRRDVLGAEWVDSHPASDEFMATFLDAVTELAWGYAWSRPGLDRRSRFILTLGILAGLGRHAELGIYTRAAIRNGLTVDEIKEILVHVTAYCGTPAGRQSFLAAHASLKDAGALP